MQSHDCAKYLRICANFGKHEKLVLILCIGHILTKKIFYFYYITTYNSAQNFQSEHIDCATEFAFRKSAGSFCATPRTLSGANHIKLLKPKESMEIFVELIKNLINQMI